MPNDSSPNDSSPNDSSSNDSSLNDSYQMTVHQMTVHQMTVHQMTVQHYFEEFVYRLNWKKSFSVILSWYTVVARLEPLISGSVVKG